MPCLVTAFLLFAAAAQAVVVAPGSPCAASCGNVLDSTSSDDLVCSTGAYAGPTGQLFQGCIECELRSSFHNPERSDVYSMLYNLRYSLSYCLFGVPHNDQLANTPCITSKACGPFGDAFSYGNLSSDFANLEYCSKWPLNTDVDYRSCTECLQAADNNYLANFATILQAGCEQKPVPGVSVGVVGDIFSNEIVNITAPTPTATVDPAWFDQGPLSLSAKVGIAVGVIVVLLVMVGFAITGTTMVARERSQWAIWAWASKRTGTGATRPQASSL
ncbi:hypothetical protein CDD82_7471 [Ophiocordyceps australis]|uniref:LPXTG-domain-containing protein n=1 Tax=Ophiocordyceps australis TaxID=1399860 RepID=A0A2C5YQ57_9HYPO|nr:hypothetical protein CDD82_7471 [Ophiocordyceps australis]